MYKLTITSGKNDTLKIVTIFKKKGFYFFSYWDAVERVLCSHQYLNNHLQRYTSKYNIALNCTEPQLMEGMQATV